MDLQAAAASSSSSPMIRTPARSMLSAPATSAAASSSSSLEGGSASPVDLAAIAALFGRCCWEYDAAPTDSIAHLDRHRDSPAIYRNGSTHLFDPLQKLQYDTLFPPSGEAAEEIFSASGAVGATPNPHPLRTSEGVARIVNDRSPSPELKMTLAACLEQKDDFVLSDVVPAASMFLHRDCVYLHLGPALFRPLNLLDDLPAKLDDHDYSLAQFTITRGDTHTGAHTAWYGTDTVVVQGVGESLWLMAPPDRTREFMDLFPQTHRFDLSSEPTRAKLSQLASWSGSAAVHVKEGAVVMVPGGWPRLAKHLTPRTASFGWSYLRAWKLSYCLQWAAQRSQEEVLSKVNLEAVFKKLPTSSQAASFPPYNGVSATRAAEAVYEWARLMHRWSDPDPDSL